MPFTIRIHTLPCCRCSEQSVRVTLDMFKDRAHRVRLRGRIELVRRRCEGERRTCHIDSLEQTRFSGGRLSVCPPGCAVARLAKGSTSD